MYDSDSYMAMPPLETGVAVWDHPCNRDATFKLDCFLPNGVYVDLKVNHDATLSEIKDRLWYESQRYPLFTKLRDRHFYLFMCINQMAEKEELVDEDKRVCDVKPFMQMLKVVEKRGDKREKVFNSQISSLIGKALGEFDAIIAAEVGDFRKKLKRECKNIGKMREQQDWLQKALYMYPPDVASSMELPKYLKEKVKDQVFLKISIAESGVTMTIDVPFSSYPQEVIRSIEFRKPQFKLPKDAEKYYVLKICGRDEYLLGEYPLSQYNRIRKMMSRSKLIHLILINLKVFKSNMKPQLHPRADVEISGTNRVPGTPTSRHGSISCQTTWDIPNPYEITMTHVSNTNMEAGTKVCIRAGIYHGGQILCQHKNTKEATIENGLAQFGEVLTFDLQVADIPRMARLCFLLYSIDRKGKAGKNTFGKRIKEGRQEIRTLAWVNYPVFDYKDNLRGGTHTLFMWNITDDNVLTEELLNALGTIEGNPNSTESIGLNIDLGDYTEGNNGLPVKYPSKQEVLQFAAEDKGPTSLTLRDKQLLPLRQLIDRDPLDALHEQDKEVIWMLRMECLEYFPDISLPKLLLCISWNKHDEVAQMLLLLERWPRNLKASKALELLDFNHPEMEVRSFAVECLEQIEDNELANYLLQLVQVLKYECYLDCDLVHFLLRRALTNQRIGHYFFWLLRSEMHVPSVSVRFGLILEAYCHGCPQHVVILAKQVQALSKLRSLTYLIRNLMKVSTKEKVREEMRLVLSAPGYSEALSNFSSTLDPRFKLANVQIDKCNFMDSKMRPLWMVWNHTDSHLSSDQPTVYAIYKDGDDLRQDMLTLQIIGIMDQIWQSKGYDLRMTPYQVLATGCNEGLIETVLNAHTIAKIQQQYTNIKVKAAFNENCIYQFLCDNCKTQESLKNAIEEFTLSCAGYCVATYVLGIGDRHADNIMIKENGQLFHIDFGHVLGNFKSKFGYKRERVPFVLTADFTTVINHGSKVPKNEDLMPAAFKRFQSLCEEAYLALHDESNLFITLFLMMTNTGIPELSNVRDIEYLRKTLCPSQDRESARNQFRSKFREAKDNGFSSSLNNFFHHLNH